MNLTQNPLEVKDEGLKMPVTEDEKIAYIRKKNEERLSRVRVIQVLKEPESETKKTNDELQEMLARLAKKSEEAKSKEIDTADPLEKQIVERETFLEQKRRTKEAFKAELKAEIEEQSEFQNELTGEELFNLNIPPPNYAVNELAPEGLILLAGRAKEGKSYLNMVLSVAIACKRKVLDKFDAEAGDVLYFNLEDPHGLAQDRLKEMYRLLPKNGEDSGSLKNLSFVFEVKSLDELIDKMGDWLEKAQNPKLVIIDTLAAIMPKDYDPNNFNESYRFAKGFRSWAQKNHVAVIIVHHTGKSSRTDPVMEIMGSTGLLAVPQTFWILTRKKGKDGKEQQILYTKSKRYSRVSQYCIDYERTGYWSISGEYKESENISPQRKQILNLLKEKPMSIKKASEILGMEYNNVKQFFYQLFQSGKIQKDDNGDFFISG